MVLRFAPSCRAGFSSLALHAASLRLGAGMLSAAGDLRASTGGKTLTEANNRRLDAQTSALQEGESTIELTGPHYS